MSDEAKSEQKSDEKVDKVTTPDGVTLEESELDSVVGGVAKKKITFD